MEDIDNGEDREDIGLEADEKKYYKQQNKLSTWVAVGKGFLLGLKVPTVKLPYLEHTHYTYNCKIVFDCLEFSWFRKIFFLVIIYHQLK